MRFIKATYTENLKTVEYEAIDGSRFLKTGGTLNWRFNNPGNITALPYSQKQPGRIGSGTVHHGQSKNTFLIYPSIEVGEREKKNLLRRKYKEQSIPEMTEIYSPSSDGNDPVGYAKFLMEKTGISANEKIGDLDDEKFNKLVNAISTKEGGLKPGEEKWVYVTNITVSDGSRPVADVPFNVTLDKTTYEWKTDSYGKLKPIIHMKKGMVIAIKYVNSAGKEDIVYSAIAGDETKNVLITRQFSQFTASTLVRTPKIPREKSQPKPINYIVRSGDTLSKIATRYQVTVDELAKSNNIKDVNKIYPGQTIVIYHQSAAVQSTDKAKSVSTTLPDSTTKDNPTSPPAQKVTAVTHKLKLEPVGSKSSGNPISILPHDQREAPWMAIAIHEAYMWAGVKEGNIGHNYHQLINPKCRFTLSNTPWCASFVNYCLIKAFYPRTANFAGSNSFVSDVTNFKQIKEPIYGCLMVWRKGEHGHVAFVYGRDTISNEIIVLGGNQNDSINFMLESNTTKKLVGFFIPVSYSSKNLDLQQFDIVELNESIKYPYKRKGIHGHNSIVKDR